MVRGVSPAHTPAQQTEEAVLERRRSGRVTDAPSWSGEESGSDVNGSAAQHGKDGVEDGTWVQGQPGSSREKRSSQMGLCAGRDATG